MDESVSAEQFAAVARAMRAQTGTHLTMNQAVAAAVELIEGCDSAAISLVPARKKPVETLVATSDLARDADQLQFNCGEGPGFDALRDRETVIVGDLRTETRWPQWSGQAADKLDLHSMLAVQLFVTDDSLGAMTLYSKTTSAFDRDDEHAAAVLAAHTAVALVASHGDEHARAAVSSRTLIGQAEGILMERFDLTGDQAFAVLKRLSQHSNRKLRSIAGDLVNGVGDDAAGD